MIASRGPLNLRSVADGLGVHPSNTTRTCDRLVATGLLTRRDDPADRRNPARREGGWDPTGQILAPPPDHPGLGWTSPGRIPVNAGAGRTPLISARPAPSRCPPSASTASAHTCLGIELIAARSRSVIAQPTENPQLTPVSRKPRMWARNSRVQPAPSARTRIGCHADVDRAAAPRRRRGRRWGRRQYSSRRCPCAAARNSPVLSQNASNG